MLLRVSWGTHHQSNKEDGFYWWRPLWGCSEGDCVREKEEDGHNSEQAGGENPMTTSCQHPGRFPPLPSPEWEGLLGSGATRCRFPLLF